MPHDIPLRCRCGKVQGVATGVSPAIGTHIVCYCDDCQAFARFLGRDDLTDPHGGTGIFQMPPNRVRIDTGADEVRCVRLSPKGMLRWYAGCCDTPIGNTLANPRAPFVGMISAFMDHSGGPARDEALGPAVGTMGRFARGGAPAGVHPKAPIGLIFRILRMLARGALAGAHSPSPFLDPSGEPRVAPRVLTPDEREKLGHHERASA